MAGLIRTCHYYIYGITMKKNNKSMTMLVIVLLLAFSPILIIKTFNIKNKTESGTNIQKKFSLIELVRDLNDENRQLLILIIETALGCGVIGFFIGFFFKGFGKRNDEKREEIVCPVCKEKFLKKTLEKK